MVGAVAINVLIVSLVGLAIRSAGDAHNEHAVILGQNIALLVEREVSNLFDRMDRTLRECVQDIAQDGAAGTERINDILRRQETRLPEILSIGATDAAGRSDSGAEASSPDAMPDLRESEQFIRQRDLPRAGLVIAKPFQLPGSGEWVLPLSRRLNDQRGQFAGIVYVNLPVAYLVQKLSTLELRPHGMIGLRNMDGLSLARVPEIRAGDGAPDQVAVLDRLRALLADQPAGGIFRGKSPVDGIERLFVYRKAATHPFYVLVGLAFEDYLDEWHRDETLLVGMLLLSSGLALALAWMVLRALRQQQITAELLRENEMRWSLALDSGNYSVWDWDLRTGRVTLSKRGKQMFHFGDDEIGDDVREWAALVHPDDKPRVMDDLRAILRGDTPAAPTEYRVRSKDGGWRWILTRAAVAARDARGRVTRMVGTHVDTTERREREEALRLAATAFEISDEGVIVTNANHEIISVNSAFSTITGYTPQEVIGRNPKILSAKTQPKAFYQSMWQALADTGSWQGEVLNRRKNGEVYVEWLSIKRIADANGQLVRHVAVFSDITTRKAEERRIQHLALHDALTDLPNRALLAERLAQAITRARRDGEHLGLLYFDLDKFKPVNDRYGHDVGDGLLKEVAQRVGLCVRASDTVARVGGDEFVVLLVPVQEVGDVLAVAEKIRAAIDAPFDIAGHVLEVEVSIGVAIYPEHGSDEATLTQHADAAMYQAKRSGRNQVLLYQPGM